MKILQINNYHYLRGGSETVYFQTTEILQKHGHDLIHFSTQNEKNEASDSSKYFIKERSYLEQGTFKKVASSLSFLYSFESARNIENLIVDEKPDIAHLHIFFGQITSSVLKVLKKYNIPVVMTVHEYKMLCPTYLMKRPDGSICEKCASGNYIPCVRNKCNKKSLAFSGLMALESYVRDKFIPYEKYIDKFIFVSNFLYQKHIEYKPQIKEKSIVIHNALAKNSEAYHSRDYFLYVGRLSPEKGIFTLIKAMSKFPSKSLKIVGEGPQRVELENYIDTNQLSNIELVGYQSGEALELYYKNADFLFMPSEWYETFGMTILESFSYGKPVAISNIGGMPELLLSKLNGFLFNYADQPSLEETIIKIINLSDDEYMQMSLSCIQSAKEFGIEKYYNELIDVYDSVISNPS